MLTEVAAPENRLPRRKGRIAYRSEPSSTVNPQLVGGSAQNKRLDRISPTKVHPPLPFGVV